MSADSHQPMMSAHQVAEFCGLSLKTIRRDTLNGKLSSSKPCARRLYSQVDVDAYISLNRLQSAAPRRLVAQLTGDHTRKAVRRYLEPLVREVLVVALEQLDRRVEALEKHEAFAQAKPRLDA